jgi:4-amino-4-deoxychorismate lyase
VALTVCRTRFGDNPALAGIKHLNRLEQVLAQSEWDEPAIFDGLMMDQRGRVVSGTRSNLFLVTARGLVTPSLERCGVAGTARATVIERCTALGIPVVEREIRWRELADAQGLFVTNALVGLLPVSRVDAVRFDPSAIPAALVDQVREAVFTSEASC